MDAIPHQVLIVMNVTVAVVVMEAIIESFELQQKGILQRMFESMAKQVLTCSQHMLFTSGSRWHLALKNGIAGI